jgi:hypothetical protein
MVVKNLQYERLNETEDFPAFETSTFIEHAVDLLFVTSQ